MIFKSMRMVWPQTYTSHFFEDVLLSIKDNPPPWNMLSRVSYDFVMISPESHHSSDVSLEAANQSEQERLFLVPSLRRGRHAVHFLLSAQPRTLWLQPLQD